MRATAALRGLDRNRRGTTSVEVAVVLPVFLTFVFALVEYGRVQLVANLLNTACRSAARLGSSESVTSAEAEARVKQVLSSVVDPQKVSVIVRSAAVFDSGGAVPVTPSELNQLPGLELGDAESRQLFLVRASVNYNDIALAPIPALQGATLSGQAFMRHE